MIHSLQELAAVIDDLRSTRKRVLVGVVGEPGSGKSTLTRALVRHLNSPPAVIPMDGFHLANAELARLGRADRKGAPDTFDVAGYVHLLSRLRHREDPVTYAPDYVRAFEEPIAGAVAVPASVATVLTEGNYLLHTADGWGAVKPLLDHVWYLECNAERRIERLVRRHERFGKTHDEATRWATGSDEVNARLIRSTRVAADLIIDFDGLQIDVDEGALRDHIAETA